MNTATEVKLEGDPERSSIDRRRGMKLVAPGKRPDKKRPFSITVSDQIFSEAVIRASSARTPTISAGSNARETQPNDSGRTLATLTAGIAVVGALLVGYLIGRKRD